MHNQIDTRGLQGNSTFLKIARNGGVATTDSLSVKGLDRLQGCLVGGFAIAVVWVVSSLMMTAGITFLLLGIEMGRDEGYFWLITLLCGVVSLVCCAVMNVGVIFCVGFVCRPLRYEDKLQSDEELQSQVQDATDKFQGLTPSTPHYGQNAFDNSFNSSDYQGQQPFSPSDYRGQHQFSKQPSSPQQPFGPSSPQQPRPSSPQQSSPQQRFGQGQFGNPSSPQPIFSAPVFSSQQFFPQPNNRGF